MMSTPILEKCRLRRSLRQFALFEFASLKSACPEGIYLSLRPGNPCHWTGVFFVREGPYSAAVLRFHVLFPPNYPAAPPSITFISDIFHPLVTPLTTYTYSTGSVSSDKASATDEERLPPGGFSLRHEFPHWFRRAQMSDTCSTTSSRKVSGSQDGPTKLAMGANGPSISVSPASGKLAQIFQSPRSEGATPLQVFRSRNSYSAPSILEVLYYVKRAFDDHTTLDQLPLEAAGNLGAWKAWRAHRGSTPQNMMPETKIVSIADNDSRKQTFLEPLSNHTKQQDDWSWEGVWEKRVREGIEASISDVALYGSSAGIDDIIRFVDIDETLIRIINDQASDMVSN